jgi:hypothetical protein
MIAKLSIQPNAASAMAAAKNTKKHLISGMRGRSVDGLPSPNGSVRMVQQAMTANGWAFTSVGYLKYKY